MTIPRELLDELVRREAASTPGPWTGSFGQIDGTPGGVADDVKRHDRAFIISAKNNLPAIAAWVAEMEAQIDYERERNQNNVAAADVEIKRLERERDEVLRQLDVGDPTARGLVRAAVGIHRRIKAAEAERDEAMAHARDHHLDGGCMTCMACESERDEDRAHRLVLEAEAHELRESLGRAERRIDNSLAGTADEREAYERSILALEHERDEARAQLESANYLLEAAMADRAVLLKHAKVDGAARNDLLAVIHRDGGQYTGSNGVEKSCADAQHRVIQERTELDRLAEALRQACKLTAEPLAPNTSLALTHRIVRDALAALDSIALDHSCIASMCDEIDELRAQRDKLAEALRGVLSSALLEGYDADGNSTHDWSTCEQLSCRNARAALGALGAQEKL